MKTKVVYEQPAVKFMHDLVVVLDGAGPGERWFRSTFPELNDRTATRPVLLCREKPHTDRLRGGTRPPPPGAHRQGVVAREKPHIGLGEGPFGA